MMRSVISAIVLTLVLVSLASAQQTAAATNSVASDQDIQLLRKDLQSARKQIVAANMLLSDNEAQKFWPVYDSYTAEASKINDVKVSVLKDYAASYQNLTDAKAESLVKRWGAADESAIQLRTKYFSKFQQAISGTKAARFFQIDRRISMLVDLQVASEVPLVEP